MEINEALDKRENGFALRLLVSPVTNFRLPLI